MAVYLTEMLHVAAAQIQLVLLRIQIRVQITECRIDHILARKMLVYVKGSMAVLIVGQQGRVVEQVGRRVRRVQLPCEGILALAWDRLGPVLVLVKLAILSREVVVLLPRVVAVAAVLALPRLHPGTRPDALHEDLFDTQTSLTRKSVTQALAIIDHPLCSYCPATKLNRDSENQSNVWYDHVMYEVQRPIRPLERGATEQLRQWRRTKGKRRTKGGWLIVGYRRAGLTPCWEYALYRKGSKWPGSCIQRCVVNGCKVERSTWEKSGKIELSDYHRKKRDEPLTK